MNAPTSMMAAPIAHTYGAIPMKSPSEREDAPGTVDEKSSTRSLSWYVYSAVATNVRDAPDERERLLADHCPDHAQRGRGNQEDEDARVARRLVIPQELEGDVARPLGQRHRLAADREAEVDPVQEQRHDDSDRAEPDQDLRGRDRRRRARRRLRHAGCEADGGTYGGGAEATPPPDCGGVGGGGGGGGGCTVGGTGSTGGSARPASSSSTMSISL